MTSVAVSHAKEEARVLPLGVWLQQQRWASMNSSDTYNSEQNSSLVSVRVCV